MGCRPLRGLWLGLLLLLLRASQARLPRAHFIRKLQQDINSRFSWTPVTWTEALASNDTRLYLHRVVQTQQVSKSHNQEDMETWDAQLNSSRLPITIFTTASVSRLHQLKRQCQAWPGQIVASLWVPIVIPPAPPPSTPTQRDSGTEQPPTDAASHVAEGASTDGIHDIQRPDTSSSTSHRTGHPGGVFGWLRSWFQPSTKPRQQASSKAAPRQLRQEGPKRASRRDGPVKQAATPAQHPRPQHHRSHHDEKQDAGSPAKPLAADVGTGQAPAATAEGPQVPAVVAQALGSAEAMLFDMMAQIPLQAMDAGTNQLLGHAPQQEDESGLRCDLTVLVFGQIFDSELSATYLFPINVLRNYAALMVTTPLLTMLDVDLMFSTQFTHNLLHDPKLAHSLVERAAQGNLFIPPALEAKKCDAEGCASGVAEGLAAAHGTKALVHDMFQNGSLDTFHCLRGTHFIVDFDRWFKSEKEYEVRFAVSSEPWFIGHRSILPFYDSRFKGFGFNKQIHVAYTVGNVGLRLIVLPDAWLIHIPHSYTAAARVFGAGGNIHVHEELNAAANTSTGAPRPESAGRAQVINKGHRSKGKHTGTVGQVPQPVPQPQLETEPHSGLADLVLGPYLANMSQPGRRLQRQVAPFDQELVRALLHYRHLVQDGGMEELPLRSDIYGGTGAGHGHSSSVRSLSGLLTQGGASVPVSTSDPAVAQQVQTFYKTMWAMGQMSLNMCPLPSNYTPVLPLHFLDLLHTLPWWSSYSQKWSTGQPSPADIKVDPPRLPHIAKDKLWEAKKAMQRCTQLPSKSTSA